MTATPSNNIWTAEQEAQVIERITAELARKGGQRTNIEPPVEYGPGEKITLPMGPNPPETQMSYDAGAQFLSKLAESEKEMHQFTEDFMCRPPDGALALNRVLKNRYGITAIGKAVRGWGGTQLPELKTVHLSPTESVQVPWGRMDFPPLKCQFQMFARNAKDYGPAFSILVVAAKQTSEAIHGLFEEVREELVRNSIYRHTALEGLGTDIDGDGFWAPRFLDAYAEDRSEIFYSSPVYRDLHHSLWGRIKYYDLLKEEGIIFNPKVLLYGPNGSGKTAAALVTAQLCLEHQMGYIQCRHDEDLEMVVNVASHIGHPMIVGVEDSKGELVSNARFDQILNLFDGTNNKGREVGLLVSTNHAEKLPADLLRTRRFNRTIQISDLDADALHKLLDVKIPAVQRTDLDYDRLEDVLEGFMPSSVVQTTENARVASIIRTGKRGEPITTDDIVMEAEGLRPQIELHRKALEVQGPPELTEALGNFIDARVDASLERHTIDLSDGEIMSNG